VEEERGDKKKGEEAEAYHCMTGDALYCSRTEGKGTSCAGSRGKEQGRRAGGKKKGGGFFSKEILHDNSVDGMGKNAVLRGGGGWGEEGGSVLGNGSQKR